MVDRSVRQIFFLDAVEHYLRSVRSAIKARKRIKHHGPEISQRHQYLKENRGSRQRSGRLTGGGER